MREWNAETYHRVSDPMRDLGGPVLARLPLAGTERVLDVGCGTGRVTDELRARLPRGSIVAIDLSENMLAVARRHLGTERVHFVRADAAALPFRGQADAIFSTATLHWVRDHHALFAGCHAALRPGGRLVAQCGGAGNIRRVVDRCAVLMQKPRFAAHYAGWDGPWEFPDAETTAARLRAAGFEDVRAWLEATPILQPDAAAYREFVANVVCRGHLARLPEPALRDAFVDALTEQASADDPPFALDYVRLNLEARKPV